MYKKIFNFVSKRQSNLFTKSFALIYACFFSKDFFTLELKIDIFVILKRPRTPEDAYWGIFDPQQKSIITFTK